MDVERSVRSWIATEKDVEVEKLVRGISLDGVTILDIVKALGEYLTSEEDHLRTKGVQMLSLVIERCPRDKLNRQAVRVLTTFYCTKLEDTETITPALSGLSQLVTFPSFSSLEVSDVLSAIFRHVEMKSLVQSTRFHVYSVVNTFVNTFRGHLQNMGEEFVSNYAVLASGEKDPRNLLVAFKIARVILTDFDISKHVETYFDIIFCYYPITWLPGPDDPVNIDDLKGSLRSCLSATPVFGSLGTSLFLEKLAFGSSSTKRDALETMAICLPVYGFEIAREFGRKIWSTLKLEIFQPTDSLTEEIALRTLRTFLRVLLSTSSGGTDDANDTVIRTIIADSLGSIGEPEKPQAKAGMKVLSIFVDTPSESGNDAVNGAVEKLIELFHDPGEVSNRAAVTMLLTDLLNAFVASSTQDPSMATEQPSVTDSFLMLHKDAILGMLTAGLKSPATRLPAVRGLSSITRIPALLTDAELRYVVLETGEFAGKESVGEIDDVTTDVISLLSSIALKAPRHLADQTLPLLFTMLPEQAPPVDARPERNKYWRALCTLSKLCVHPSLFEILVIRLTAKLELLCSLSVSQEVLSGGTTNTEETERSTAYAHALLLTLANTLAEKVSRADPDVPKYVDQLLPHLFRLFLGAAVAGEHQILQDHRLLRVCARIVKLVVEGLSIEQQQRFTDGMCAAFLHGQIKIVTGEEFPFVAEEFRPIRVDASASQRETVILFAAALVPIHKEVSVFKNPGSGGQPTLSVFLKTLVGWCDSFMCTTLQRDAASELFATLVNKYADDIPDFLDEMLTGYFSTTINNPRVHPEVRCMAIGNWVWISRGLVVRSHPLAVSFVEPLLTLLDDEVVAWCAARDLGVLVADDGTLTKRNGAVLKILHVQRCFNGMLPKVVDGAKKVDGTKRDTAYLIALASLINAVPKSLYGTQLPALMPLLLRGLEITDPDIRQQIIEIISNNINAFLDDELLSTYASTLVATMLKNCTIVDMPEYRVRVAALKCLALLPGIVRYDMLHPYKLRVLKDLAKALDDPKRVVRKEAVDARTKWYKYSGYTMVLETTRS